MSVFELGAPLKAKTESRLCGTTLQPNNHSTSSKALHFSYVHADNMLNAPMAALKVFAVTNCAPGCATPAVVSDDPLCHPLPHAPEATRRMQSVDSVCMCELLWLCGVGAVCPPYAIVQTCVRPKVDARPLQQVIHTFNFHTCYIVLNSSTSLCATLCNK